MFFYGDLFLDLKESCIRVKLWNSTVIVTQLFKVEIGFTRRARQGRLGTVQHRNLIYQTK